MKVDLMGFMKAVLESLGIQTLLLNPPYENISDIDYQLRKRLFEDYRYSKDMEGIRRLCQPGVFLHLKDDFQLCYCMFLFPENLREEYQAQYCVIGPYMISRMNSAYFMELMEEKGIPSGIYRETAEFYNRIPLISDYDSWIAQCSVFATHILGEQTVIHFADSQDAGSLRCNYADYQIRSAPELAITAVEERYKVEQDMLSAVTGGNAEQAIALHHKFITFKLTPRTPDPIRNQKNILITFNTLLRKAVQAGYVHPIHIDNLSAQFAVQIEAAVSENQLNKLSLTMIRKYCLLVKNYSRRAYSALVQASLDYIDFHYSEELSLDTLAKMRSVSNSYLSALFKKEVQMTVTDYINSTRIRQSLILLNTTALSIQDIAYQCGFTDSNYFTRIFKKFQGKSPKLYREEIRK